MYQQRQLLVQRTMWNTVLRDPSFWLGSIQASAREVLWFGEVLS